MKSVAVRNPAAARAGPCGLRSVNAPRTAVRARAAPSDEPSNVAEAREWVDKWRAKQAAGGSKAGAGAGAGAGAKQEKPAQKKKQEKAAAAPAPPTAKPEDNGAGKLRACKSFEDGTLLFTAERLKSVNFNDVKL